MNKINYIEGDLFKSVLTIKNKKIFIPHVCNTEGVWSGGFVIPLAEHFPKAREDYLEWWQRNSDLPLGEVQYVYDADVAVCNMIAQVFDDNPRFLKYNALVHCMENVANVAKELVSQGFDVEIHAPMFGSGIAGGNWQFVEELIKDIWLDNGLKVNVYYLPQFLPKGWTPPKKDNNETRLKKSGD